MVDVEQENKLVDGFGQHVDMWIMANGVGNGHVCDQQ